jgi:SAM-dependent methyltransferase
VHQSSLARVKAFIDHHLADRRGTALRVLDVGGTDVNGSYRPLFDDPAWTYSSLDIEPGPGVDIVPKRAWFWQDVPSRSFDVVVSGQAFEHIAFPWVTILEIRRVLAPGGLLCLVAPSGGPEHRYPLDCWRFYRDGMVALALWADFIIVEAAVHTGEAWGDDSDDWNDAVLIARRPETRGVRARAAAAKRELVRRVGALQAARRGAHIEDEITRLPPSVTRR